MWWQYGSHLVLIALGLFIIFNGDLLGPLEVLGGGLIGFATAGILSLLIDRN